VNTQGARAGVRDREAFFCAAYELLAERGCTGLTIAAMCERLRVTKGSFYHHFEDMPAFVAAFAQRWQTYFVGFFDSFAQVPDARRRLAACANNAGASISPGVRSVLAWARTNQAIADAVGEVYRSVWALSAGSFTDWAGDSDTGAVLGPMANSVAIGAQSRPRVLSAERWILWCAAIYEGLGVTGGVIRVEGRPCLQVHSWRRMDTVATSAGDVADLVDAIGIVPGADAWTRLGTASGSRDRYFGAAGELLAAQGSDGLTVAAMVDRLELTKGSFHHHFGALPDFVTELAAAWAAAELHRVEELLAERNPWRRLELLHADLLVGPTQAAVAWRAWSHSNPSVASAVRAVDERRERALALTLARIRGTCDERFLAEMTYSMSLGLHAWQPSLDRGVIARAAIEWMRRMLDIEAEVVTAAGVPTLALRAA
jgi:AcrR family transcriptional regulator